MSVLPRRAITLAAWVVLVLCACGPTPGTSAKAPSPSPGVSPNPYALAPMDCTAPAPSNGTKIHSAALGASVTVPAGWAEDPTMEGQQGMQVAFDLVWGSGPNGANISGDLIPLTMSPHDTVEWMVTQPRSGTVVAKGDCTIAGGKAAFFKSTVPGIAVIGGGYSLVFAHREQLIYLVILLPSDREDSVMPEVKSILGSWQCDPA